MTLNYGIFDSADPASPDRTYTATLLSRILSKYLSNGVVSGDLNELKVSVTDPPAMKVIVATGTAIVQGRFIENDAALTLNVSAAHATYPRIDRVVVRLSAVTARTVDIAVKAGTAASSPVAPELTQTTDVYEIPLAQIAVGAGVTSILTANLTDQRVFPDMTNLFKAAVSMLSDLNVGGDLVVDGELDVSGNAAIHGTVTFAGGNVVANVTGDVTGDITGLIKHACSVKSTAGVFNLGEVIAAYSLSGIGTSASGVLTTGLVARIAAFSATNPAFAIFDNLGILIPFNINVGFSYNAANGHYTVTTKDIEGNVINTQTYTDYDNTGHMFTVPITALTDSVSVSVSGPYSANYSCSCSAYYATFD